MTTYKAHVNLMHNQCLALQTIVSLRDPAATRNDSRAVWIYEHAARHILPELYEGTEERSLLARPFTPRAFYPMYLPKVMIVDSMIDDDATRVNFQKRTARQ